MTPSAERTSASMMQRNALPLDFGVGRIRAQRRPPEYRPLSRSHDDVGVVFNGTANLLKWEWPSRARERPTWLTASPLLWRLHESYRNLLRRVLPIVSRPEARRFVAGILHGLPHPTQGESTARTGTASRCASVPGCRFRAYRIAPKNLVEQVSCLSKSVWRVVFPAGWPYVGLNQRLPLSQIPIGHSLVLDGPVRNAPVRNLWARNMTHEYEMPRISRPPGDREAQSIAYSLSRFLAAVCLACASGKVSEPKFRASKRDAVG
jgi:hypothetical protein